MNEKLFKEQKYDIDYRKLYNDVLTATLLVRSNRKI